MSTILSANDLNDFITPGVACIKPADDSEKRDKPQLELEIEIDQNGEVSEVNKNDSQKNKTKLQKAQISLADCLACSGCITSAEEVLVAQHSHKNFLDAWKEHHKNKKFALSISHQTRASLATAFDVSIETIDLALIKVFVEKYNFDKVVGLGIGRRIVLNEISKELKLKRTNRSRKGPILSSACPGWVLYVEKTHPWLIENLSNIKSPQAVTGILVKSLMREEYDIRNEDIYHLSLMPCFDKKLEAAREEGNVDCVITAREVVTMFEEENIDFDSVLDECRNLNDSNLKVKQKYSPLGWFEGDNWGWDNDQGSSSGGYALDYLTKLKDIYLQENNKERKLEIKAIQGRNSDIYEMRLVDQEDGEILGKSGVINGFKNIQNLVRRLKPEEKVKNKSAIAGGGLKRGEALAARRRARKLAKETEENDGNKQVADMSQCDFVEIMACPDGCINGGGQINGPAGESVVSNKQWVAKVKNTYETIPVGNMNEPESLASWLDKLIYQCKLDKNTVLKTTYSAVDEVNDEEEDTTAVALTSTW